MKNPLIRIREDRLLANVRKIVEEGKRAGLEIVGVTKGAGGDPLVVKIMNLGGIKIFADSNLQNLSRIKKLNLAHELYLLRLPMVSQAREVVQIADVSFNSQEVTLEALSHEALKEERIHKVMIMVDVGDLREGVMPETLLPLVEKALALKGIELEGIATNVGCYGGVLPTRDQLELLISLSHKIEVEFQYRLKKISGGNTATTIFFQEGIPSGINQLRIGEGILLGYDSTNDRALPGFHQDTFILEAEVIEVERKPSYPLGTIGRDAFGQIPTFQDKGIRERAILAIGRQDVEISALTPLNEGIEILGASSDHLILDITERSHEIQTGDVLSFHMGYSALLRSMTSKYISKRT